MNRFAIFSIVISLYIQYISVAVCVHFKSIISVANTIILHVLLCCCFHKQDRTNYKMSCSFDWTAQLCLIDSSVVRNACILSYKNILHQRYAQNQRFQAFSIVEPDNKSRVLV